MGLGQGLTLARAIQRGDARRAAFTPLLRQFFVTNFLAFAIILTLAFTRSDGDPAVFALTVGVSITYLLHQPLLLDTLLWLRTNEAVTQGSAPEPAAYRAMAMNLAVMVGIVVELVVRTVVAVSDGKAGPIQEVLFGIFILYNAFRCWLIWALCKLYRDGQTTLVERLDPDGDAVGVGDSDRLAASDDAV